MHIIESITESISDAFTGGGFQFSFRVGISSVVGTVLLILLICLCAQHEKDKKHSDEKTVTNVTTDQDETVA